MNVYLVRYRLQHNGEPVDNTLYVCANTFENAYHIAQSWRNQLRFGAAHQELLVRDINLIVESVETKAYDDQ